MDDLARLAALVGIEPGYWDIFGTRHDITPDATRSLLSGLGIPAATPEEIRASLRWFEEIPWRRPLEPVTVFRRGSGERYVHLVLPETVLERSFRWTVVEEDGTSHGASFIPDRLWRLAVRNIDGTAMIRLRFPLSDDLPDGYHRLTIDGAGLKGEASLIYAPARCHVPGWLAEGRRAWGLACHLYALRTERDWGMGDFGGLAALVEAGARAGAEAIGLNPLHALFPDRPEHASPYSPSSRLFLNPLYIDVAAIPEYAEAKESEAALKKVRAVRHVDYTAVAALKWAALRRVHAAFAKQRAGGARRAAFEDFRRQGGEALWRFAVFHALQDQYPHQSWMTWPIDYRRPDSPKVAAFAKSHAEDVEFHAWCQWVAESQLAEAASAARRGGLAVGLYRDLAVGADPGGAEIWSDPDAVAGNARFGAPPDAFNPLGQDWGMPPFHPLMLREKAYAPFAQLLRANMRHAGALRIDHVMALLHLYWVPPGAKACEGAYVKYPFDDLLGVMALESARAQCLVVGEDLGTVPDDFRARMTAEGVLSYRLFYFERWPSGLFKRPDAYPDLALATATTHDLATIRGHWQGRDLELRQRLGLFASDQAMAKDAHARHDERQALLGALVDQGLWPADRPLDDNAADADLRDLVLALERYLARSPARLVMVNLDDLALEGDQLNLPGTVDEYPNWRRRLSVTLERLAADPFFAALAQAIRDERRR